MKYSTILVLAGAAIVSAIPNNSWEALSCPAPSTTTEYKYETVTYTEKCYPTTVYKTEYSTEYKTNTETDYKTVTKEEYVTAYVTQSCSSSKSWSTWGA